MKNTKEIKAILTAIFAINRTGEHEDKDISLILDYAFRRLFGANTNLLILSYIGKTKEQIMPEVMQVLKADTQYEKNIVPAIPPSPITADSAGWKSNSLNTEPTIMSISWLAHGTAKNPIISSKSIMEQSPFIFVFSVGAARFPSLYALKLFYGSLLSAAGRFFTIFKGGHHYELHHHVRKTISKNFTRHYPPCPAR